VRIAVGPTGVPWVANSAETLFRLSTNDPTTGQWTELPGGGHDIGVCQTAANNNNYVWLIGGNPIGSNGDFGIFALEEQPANHGGRLATDAPESPHLLAPKIRSRVYIAGAIEDASFTDEMRTRL
jgi:hypothetical protein